MYRNREMDNLHDILKGIPFEERKEDIKEDIDYGDYSDEELKKLVRTARNREDPNISDYVAELRKRGISHTEMYAEESKQTNEQLPKHHSAPQTMKPQEKPDIDAEDHHLEDYSEEDLEKAKDKGKATGHTLIEPKEDELKVEPKKESKLKEGGEKYPSGHPSGNITIGDTVKVLFGRYKGEVGEVEDVMSPDEDPEEIPDGQFDVKMKDGKTIYLGWDDVKLVEAKQTKKRNQLYLCNECFKTFRANESVCTHCQSEKVEKIVLQEQDVAIFKHVYEVHFEDKDGTKNSTRVEAYDEADAEKMVKEDRPEIEKISKVLKIGEGKDEPGERDGTGPVKGSYQRKKYGDKGKRKQAGEKCPYKEELPESKLHETVQELVGEVDGIDRIDQHLLNKAIEDEVIPNQFPELDVMIDELSAADVAKDLGVKDIDDVDLGDIDAVYLKYILLPRAKEASRVARESKNETLTPEQIKNLEAPKLKFSYGTVVEHKQIMEDLAKTDFFESAMVGTQVTLVDAKGIPVIYAKDDDKQWKEFSSLGFVESKLKEKEEGWSDLPDEALLTAFRVLVKEGPGSKTVGSSKDIATIFVELKKRGLEDKVLPKESKLKEQEEDSFKTLAKGIEDKDTADRLAKEKEGQVVADEEDEKKFSVIVRKK